MWKQLFWKVGQNVAPPVHQLGINNSLLTLSLTADAMFVFQSHLYVQQSYFQASINTILVMTTIQQLPIQPPNDAVLFWTYKPLTDL